jgi:predicted lipoprotein with Yx(FWY)xxD motif
MLIALLAGGALAVLTGLAIAKTFTLTVARNATVAGKTEAIAVVAHGRPVYTLSGETARHLKCTKANQCLSFWFPVTVKSRKSKPTAAPGIKGKLGKIRRNGVFQVTLSGHPLYTFKFDSKADVATGEGIKSFGGVWHVVKASRQASKTTSTGTTMSTPTSTYPYPVY